MLFRSKIFMDRKSKDFLNINITPWSMFNPALNSKTLNWFLLISTLFFKGKQWLDFMSVDQGEKSLETLNEITYHSRVCSYVHKRSLSVIVIWLDSLKVVLNLRHIVISFSSHWWSCLSFVHFSFRLPLKEISDRRKTKPLWLS